MSAFAAQDMAIARVSALDDLPSLQQSRPGMIPEQVGVAHRGLQHVHALVPAHVPHLEHRGAATVGRHQWRSCG